jgi:hypothetical protein
LDLTWTAVLRENPTIKRSFFTFIEELRASYLQQLAQEPVEHSIFRLQGALKGLDYIEQIVQKAIQLRPEEKDADTGRRSSGKKGRGRRQGSGSGEDG